MEISRWNSSQKSGSDHSIKRRLTKGFRSSKKTSGLGKQRSGGDLENGTGSESNQQRMSSSMSALNTGQSSTQPRMVKLETLEAKMANIEVSLSNSTTPKKKKLSGAISPIPALSALSSTLVNEVASAVDEDLYCSVGVGESLDAASLVYRTSKDICDQLEELKRAIRERDAIIFNLKGKLNTSMNLNRLSTSFLLKRRKSNVNLDEKDKLTAEAKLDELNRQMDAKRIIVKNLKVELEGVHISDNVDTCIQQAELEYKLGKEELNLLGLFEEFQNLKTSLENSRSRKNSTDYPSLFDYVASGENVSNLLTTEIEYDAKSPRFGLGGTETGGLYVEWSTDDSGLIKGDRLLEINGKIVFNAISKEEAFRLLSLSPNRAKIVAIRRKSGRKTETLEAELVSRRNKITEIEKEKDVAVNENVRLTHRISYLEEQVADLKRKAPSSKMDCSFGQNRNREYAKNHERRVQIFQKGPVVTTLLGSIPNLESAKNEAAKVKMPNKENFDSYDYPKETAKLYTAKICIADYKPATTKHYSPSGKVTDANSNFQNRFHSRSKHIKDAQNCVLNYATDSTSEWEYRSLNDARSIKSLELESEPNYESRFRMSTCRSSDSANKPTPPQKPARLSLQKGYSLQSIRNLDDGKSTRSSSSHTLYYQNRRNLKLDARRNDIERWC